MNSNTQCSQSTELLNVNDLVSTAGPKEAQGNEPSSFKSVAPSGTNI